MFRYRRAGRAPYGVEPPPPAPDYVVCDAVREAEEIVSRAWESELLGRGERMESVVQAALENCHSAYRQVAAAQRGGDAGTISAARTNLHEALDVARRSSAAAQRVRDALRVELNLLTHTRAERERAALANKLAQVEPGATAQPGEPTGAPAREPRIVAMASRLVKGPARLIRRLIRSAGPNVRSPR
jgi:predicted nucleic acid-binding Zn ribbon protein